MTDSQKSPEDRLLDAILMHVPFDGWSDAAFKAAVADTDIGMEAARALFPRGATDLAVAYHRRGDQAMVQRLMEEDLSELRFSERVATALWYRVEAMDDREAVRRASTLFSLPTNAPEGAKLVWETADHVWTALGDTSRDVNWYTKRATLSGVYAAVVLFWLGDDSDDQEATNRFIDRRIADVMRIEQAKSAVRSNPVLKPVMGPLGKLGEMIKAPSRLPRTDLPGVWRDPS